MAKMKVAQVAKAGGDFEIVERQIPSQGHGQVRVKVQACGICFSDHYVKYGLWPGLQFPRVPGHEIAGVIDDVGSGVTTWKKGDRVGVGWHGGQDNTCPACRAGDFANCENGAITGFTFDGGFQEYMLAPIEAIARIPEPSNPQKLLRCFAQASRHLIRCATAALFQAILWPSRALGDWAIWAFNSQINSDTASRPWDAGRKIPRSRRNLARITTSTARPPTLRKS
jgi:D-arabinose 1-dehydrogenase-like Zn-dependent alcohol dehydrogenase